MVDKNVDTVVDADTLNAGKFLFYQILLTIANFASLIILVVVLGVLLKRLGMGGLLNFK